MCRERVEVAALTVLFDRDLHRRTFRSALENAVFDEMCNAVKLVRFVTRADPIEKPERRRTHAGHLVREYDKAIIKSSFLYVFF